jgi:hypothetical protein
MTARLARFVVVALLTTGCEVGERPSSYVIPGPTVPSPLPTLAPCVWDTREELAIWVNNPVARGSLALEESGPEAFIRIDRADREWVIRGPDLTPPAVGVRTLLIRYRWQPDAGLPATAARTAYTTAYFQTTTSIHWFDPSAQAAANVDLQPRDDWTDIAFVPGQFTPPIDVQYCYLRSGGANRGVIEIDRIELVR